MESILFNGNGMERVDVEQRAEKARRFFLEGYNCAQAVVLAYLWQRLSVPRWVEAWDD